METTHTADGDAIHLHLHFQGPEKCFLPGEVMETYRFLRRWAFRGLQTAGGGEGKRECAGRPAAISTASRCRRSLLNILAFISRETC